MSGTSPAPAGISQVKVGEAGVHAASSATDGTYCIVAAAGITVWL